MDFIKTKCKQRNVNRIALHNIFGNYLQNFLFNFVNKHTSKWLSLRHVRCGHNIIPLVLKRCSQAALAGSGVFSSNARFLSGSHRPLKMSKSSLSYDKYNSSTSLLFFVFVLKNHFADTSSSAILVSPLSLSICSKSLKSATSATSTSSAIFA